MQDQSTQKYPTHNPPMPFCSKTPLERCILIILFPIFALTQSKRTLNVINSRKFMVPKRAWSSADGSVKLQASEM